MIPEIKIVAHCPFKNQCCGSSSFWCQSGSGFNFPFWCDPNPDPTPGFTHVGKSDEKKNLTLIHSNAGLHYFIFLVSNIWAIIFNILDKIFLKKTVVFPDPYSDPIRIGSEFSGVPGSVSGSRRAKMAQKNRKELKFIFWSAGCSLLRAKGFSYNLDVLYGSLGIRKLKFMIITFFFIYCSLKPWIRIRIRIQLRIHFKC